jgi:hypothetical protein
MSAFGKYLLHQKLTISKHCSENNKDLGIGRMVQKVREVHNSYCSKMTRNKPKNEISPMLGAFIKVYAHSKSVWQQIAPFIENPYWQIAPLNSSPKSESG